MTQIRFRLATFIEEQKITKNHFATKCNIDPSNLRKMLNGEQPVTEKTLSKIYQGFPDLNMVWLEKGIGRHTYSELDADYKSYQLTGLTDKRPHIPFDASAGFLSGIADGVRLDDCELRPVIHNVPDYLVTITVNGDSMNPKYESGDELAITPVVDRNALQWGQVYVLDTNDGVLLKRIYDNQDTIRCKSYNPEYPDSFVDKSSINSIWRVVALLRRFN